MKTVATALGVALALTTGSAFGQALAADQTDSAEQPGRARAVLFRAGLLGAYRRLYDLSIGAGGLALSLGGEAEHHGGHANLHALLGRTEAGLRIMELGLSGTYEVHYGGLRWGAGPGLSLLAVRRATTGNYVSSFGVGPLVRLGYDFGAPRGGFIVVEYGIMLYNGTTVQGPKLWLGWGW